MPWEHAYAGSTPAPQIMRYIMRAEYEPECLGARATETLTKCRRILGPNLRCEAEIRVTTEDGLLVEYDVRTRRLHVCGGSLDLTPPDHG